MKNKILFTFLLVMTLIAVLALAFPRMTPVQAATDGWTSNWFNLVPGQCVTLNHSLGALPEQATVWQTPLEGKFSAPTTDTLPVSDPVPFKYLPGDEIRLSYVDIKTFTVCNDADLGWAILQVHFE